MVEAKEFDISAHEIEKPYGWWIDENGGVSNNYGFVYEEIYRFFPELKNSEGKPSLDMEVMQGNAIKLFLADLLQLQVIINHWRKIYRGWNYDKTLEVVYRNIWQKIQYWFWKETEICFMHIVPWAELNALKPQDQTSQEPNWVLLSKMSGPERRVKLRKLARNEWLEFVNITDLITEFSLNHLLKNPVKVVAHSLHAANHEANKIPIVADSLAKIGGGGNVYSPKKPKIPTRKAFKRTFLERSNSDDLWPQNMLSKGGVKIPNSLGKVIEKLSTEINANVGEVKVKKVKGTKEKAFSEEEKAKIKRVEKVLKDICGEGGVGVLQKHIIIFCGLTKQSRKPKYESKIATKADVQMNKAKIVGSQIPVPVYTQVAQDAEQWIKRVISVYHPSEFKNAKHPVYQTFILLYPVGTRTQRKDEEHWVLSGRNQNGIESKKAAKWLVENLPELVEIRLKYYED